MPEKYEPNPNSLIEGVKIIFGAIVVIIVVIYFFALLSAVAPTAGGIEENEDPRPVSTR